MATLLELESQGFLVRLVPSLGLRELEQRQIYVTPTAEKWLIGKLPILTARWTSEYTPYEQVGALFVEFCGGSKLQHGEQFHVMKPSGHGVWELKTADVRLFGWFCVKDVFIIVSCEEAVRLKSTKPGQPSRYQQSLEHVRKYRDNLRLDEPKAIYGEDPNGVVSIGH
jgi:hypothetical protein